MNITMTKEELMAALGVSKSAFNSITKTGTLDKRLFAIGLELKSSYKIRRATIYEVVPIELDYWDKIQIHYNVKKKKEHSEYTIARLTEDGLISSRAKLIKENKINISGYTAKRFDDILENEGLMVKDKTVYTYYNKETAEFKEITEEEYKSFWRDVSYCKELLMDNRKKLNKYEISQDTYDYRTFTILDSVGKEKGEIAMRFDTYKELQDTIGLVKLINKKR